MSTDSFILALRRFVIRRGKLNTIWLDEGSNFAGAERVMKSVKTLDQIEGAWEAPVKITKKALRSFTYDRPVYEESLETFLAEVESTLNSRPLTLVSVCF